MKKVFLYGGVDVRGAATLVGVLLAGAALAQLIVNYKWTYQVAFLVAAVMLYLLFVLRAFDLALLGYLIAVLVVQDLFAGEVTISGVVIGFSEPVLWTIAFAYFVYNRIAGPTNHSRAQAYGRFNLLFGLYGISMLVSLLYHLAPAQALRVWVTYVVEAYVVFRLAAEVLCQEQRANRFLIGLLVFAAVVSLNENAKFLFSRDFIPIRWQPSYPQEGTALKVGLEAHYFYPLLGYPARAGAFFCALLPTALMPLLKRKASWLTGLALLGALSMGINLVCYMDRGSWIAFFAVMGVVTWFIPRPRHLLGVWAIPALALMGAVLLGLVTPGDPLSDPWSIAESPRWTIWLNILRALPHVSPLVGIGWSSDLFNSFMMRFETVGYGISWVPGFVSFEQPHNSYLQLLLYAGFPAFLAFLLTVRHVYSRAITVLRSREGTFLQAALLAALAGTLAILVQAVADVTLWHGTFSAIFWLLMGMAFGLASQRHSPSPVLTI